MSLPPPCTSTRGVPPLRKAARAAQRPRKAASSSIMEPPILTTEVRIGREVELIAGKTGSAEPEPGGQAECQIHVLQRLAGGPLHHIVDYRHDDELAAFRGLVNLDMAQVGVLDVAGARELVAEAHEIRFRVLGLEAGLGRGAVAAGNEIAINGGKDAPLHR